MLGHQNSPEWVIAPSADTGETAKKREVQLMREIRLCWTAIRTNRIDGEVIECGPWYPDTDASRKDLAAILEAGVLTMGEGSHWIQEHEFSPLEPRKNPFERFVRSIA